MKVICIEEKMQKKLPEKKIRKISFRAFRDVLINWLVFARKAKSSEDKKIYFIQIENEETSDNVK